MQIIGRWTFTQLRVGISAWLALCVVGVSPGATIVTTTASQTDFTTAYNASSAGDTIIITNEGSPATWTSHVAIRKTNLTIIGITGTIIAKGSGDGGFRVESNNVHITNITFDRGVGSSTGPFIQIGEDGTCPDMTVFDWRISSNRFLNVGPAGSWVTGNHAISAQGYTYGLIDRNTFDRCTGEIINICADGTNSLTRSQDFGGYTNGSVFVENNIFNSGFGETYENIIDGNSGQRVVARYNTINVSNSTEYGSAIVSTHETCATCTGSSVTCGDAGSLVTEVYGNTVNLHGSGVMRDWCVVRGGRGLIYSNNVTFTGSPAGRYDVGMWISNYRSTSTYGGGGVCLTAAHARGYSQYSHEVDAGFTSEGLEASKTTLNGGIDASVTTITLTSTTGFNEAGNDDGYAIKIENEVIYYTAVSGSTLTGCTRGASGSTAATHSNGAAVHYLIFGQCLEQPNNTYIWGNSTNGVVGTRMNDVTVCNAVCANVAGEPDYTDEDIKSFAERPNNWQYRDDGVGLSYTAYSYPHPLTGESQGGPSVDTRATISGNATIGGRVTISAQ